MINHVSSNKMIFFFVLLASLSMQGQERPKRDTLYDKIEKFSKKGKVSKFIYHLIFRNVSDAAVVPNTNEQLKKDYSGRHIRNIYIQSYDPLGYDSDMQKRDSKWFEKFGNRLHRRSRNFAIRGYLLFKKGDEYNEQKLYESERILRDTRFINRASIKVIDSSATKDSVDISVRVLDAWSLRPTGEFSGRKFGVGITEDNFLGLGHEFSTGYKTDFKTKQNYLRANYAANNIYGTYINAKILGERDYDKNENVYLRIDREFVSPLTRWAAGINTEYYRHKLLVPIKEFAHPQDLPVAGIKVYNQDVWAGYQIPVNKNKSEKVTDNVVFTARFQNLKYVESPDETLDPGHFFEPFQLYLGSVGFTRRKFDVRKNIFNYDMPEDIPYGFSLFATGGVMSQRYFGNMPYAGLSLGYGTFTNAGYFNYKIQYGTFFNNQKNYRSAFRVDGTYFSPLREYGAVKLRHFLSQTFVLGNRRSDTYIDRVNLASKDEFPEFNTTFVGNGKLVLRYQLQLFITKPWKNFYINPYAVAAFGWLANDSHDLFTGKTYSKYGIGLHFYNPYLSFNRLQVSFVFYPNVPFETHPAFDFNEYRNNRMPINNFMGGRPGIVNYNN